MLANWAGRIAFHLAPIIDAMIGELKASDRLFADETTVPVLAPRTGKTRKDCLSAAVRDQRGWRCDDPSGMAFTYVPGRSGQHADKILEGFCGALYVDGSADYNRLLKRPAEDVRGTSCWTHICCKLYEISQSGDALIAQGGVNRGALSHGNGVARSDSQPTSCCAAGTPRTHLRCL
ncbi:IS66 family transposase [Actibacterium sp. 188UL27-1]|uniref:IS66 family transposase n=1 Tax=Actibacterium sp. 188UL27-1 TaxID=2786961 RepID=UPI001EF627BB